MRVILYLALLGATAFALPVYNEKNQTSLVHERTNPVDINPTIQTQVFTQNERSPSVSNIIPEEQIPEHQPGRIPQKYDKDANGLLDQSEYEGWRAAENIIVLPFEAVDRNDDGYVNNMELRDLSWSSPNELNVPLPGYDDDNYVFDDMMPANVFLINGVSDMVNTPLFPEGYRTEENYMGVVVHAKPNGDVVNLLNVNPVNNFPDDDIKDEYEPEMPKEEENLTPIEIQHPQNEKKAEETMVNKPEEDGLIESIIDKESIFPQTKEPEPLDSLDEEVIDEVNPAEEGIYQPEDGGLTDSMVNEENIFSLSKEPEPIDSVDEEIIDEMNPAEERIYQPEEGGLIDSMVGKDSIFPQSEEPESIDPVDEEVIDEVNPVDEEVIDEVNPAEEEIYQIEDDGLTDSMVDEESIFPVSKEPEPIDSVDEEVIDEINPAEERIYQPEEGGLIDSMVGKDSIFPQSEEPESIDPVDEEVIDEVNPVDEEVIDDVNPDGEEIIDEVNPAEEEIYHIEDDGLTDSMDDEESIFSQSNEPEPIDLVDEEVIDEVNLPEEEIYHPEDDGLIKPMVDKEIIFLQSKEMAPEDTDDEEVSDEVNRGEEKVHRQVNDELIKFIVGKKNIFPQIKEPVSVDSDDEEVVDKINPVKEGSYQQNVGDLTNIEELPLEKAVVIEEKPETVPESVPIHDDIIPINPLSIVSKNMEYKNMV